MDLHPSPEALPLLDHAVQMSGSSRNPASRRVLPIKGWPTRRAISNVSTRRGLRQPPRPRNRLPLGSDSGPYRQFQVSIGSGLLDRDLTGARRRLLILGERNGEHAVSELGLDAVEIDVGRKLDLPQESAITALAEHKRGDPVMHGTVRQRAWSPASVIAPGAYEAAMPCKPRLAKSA